MTNNDTHHQQLVIFLLVVVCIKQNYIIKFTFIKLKFSSFPLKIISYLCKFNHDQKLNKCYTHTIRGYYIINFGDLYYDLIFLFEINKKQKNTHREYLKMCTFI